MSYQGASSAHPSHEGSTIPLRRSNSGSQQLTVPLENGPVYVEEFEHLPSSGLQFAKQASTPSTTTTGNKSVPSAASFRGRPRSNSSFLGSSSSTKRSGSWTQQRASATERMNTASGNDIQLTEEEENMLAGVFKDNASMPPSGAMYA